MQGSDTVPLLRSACWSFNFLDTLSCLLGADCCGSSCAWTVINTARPTRHPLLGTDLGDCRVTEGQEALPTSLGSLLFQGSRPCRPDFPGNPLPVGPQAKAGSVFFPCCTRHMFIHVFQFTWQRGGRWDKSLPPSPTFAHQHGREVGGGGVVGGGSTSESVRGIASGCFSIFNSF